MPFPLLPPNPSQVAPNGNPHTRHFNPTGLDGYTGPCYGQRRQAGPVVAQRGVPLRDVRRFGLAVGNRGEWKR